MKRKGRKKAAALAGLTAGILVFALSFTAWAIGDMQDGVYSLQNAETGEYLMHQEQKIGFTTVYDENTCLWDIKEFHSDYENSAEDRLAYQIYALGQEKDGLVLDIENGWMSEENRVKLWGTNGLPFQSWNVIQNQEDTVQIQAFHTDEGMFDLAVKDGQLVIREEGDDPSQKWIMESHSGAFFRTVYSEDGQIVVQIPVKAEEMPYTDDAFRSFADQLSRVYDAVADLHKGKKPYRRIIVDGYSIYDGVGGLAFVYQNGNNHVFVADIREWMKDSMAGDDIYHFGAIHEIGHLYDGLKPWDFDTEVLTDLRLLYVLEKLQGKASPISYAQPEFYDSAAMSKLYQQMDGEHYSNGYSIFYTAYMFSQIRDHVGWEVFRDAFEDMDQNKDTDRIQADPFTKLTYFMDKLSEHAGEDVKAYLDPEDYAQLCKYMEERRF